MGIALEWVPYLLSVNVHYRDVLGVHSILKLSEDPIRVLCLTD